MLRRSYLPFNPPLDHLTVWQSSNDIMISTTQWSFGGAFSARLIPSCSIFELVINLRPGLASDGEYSVPLVTEIFVDIFRSSPMVRTIRRDIMGLSGVYI